MPRGASGNGWIYGVIQQTCVVATGTSAEEYLTDLAPAFSYYIHKVQAIVQVVGTGTSATRDFTLIRTRGSTDTTLASKTIALADVAAKGTVITWTLGSDLEMLDADTLSIAVAATGTQFTALTYRLDIFIRSRPQQLA